MHKPTHNVSPPRKYSKVNVRVKSKLNYCDSTVLFTTTRDETLQLTTNPATHGQILSPELHFKFAYLTKSAISIKYGERNVYEPKHLDGK